MNQHFKLVATDMDGTFLDDKMTFDMARLKKVIEKFKNDNIIFAAASGRSLSNLKKEFSEVKNDMAFIAENGTLVTYGTEMIFEAAISKNLYLSALSLLENLPYFDVNRMILSGHSGAYISEGADDDFFNLMLPYYEGLQRVADFSGIEDVILKIDTNFPPEHMAYCEDWLNERMSGLVAVTTGYDSIDIILKNVNKGLAMEKLCQRLGIAAEQVLAFGDNLNDIQMLEFAGMAVAPENARPEIKELADIIIEDHAKESVMSYMEMM